MVPYPLGRAPSQRYRLEQWAPHLRERGVELDFAPFQDEETFRLLWEPGAPSSAKARRLLGCVAARVALLGRLDAFDVVILHREALSFGPALIERLVARRRPLVFDFDDAIWLPSANAANPLAPHLKFQGKTRAIVARARAVMAGNDYLASWARRYCADVEVVPTTIELAHMYSRTRIHGPREVPVIGWTGTDTTLPYLEELAPALRTLAARRRFRLRVITGTRTPRLEGLDVEVVRWSAEREVDDLLALDLGLMPQPDAPWTRGKCGMKALQYMALGIPPVGSRNGMLLALIDDGENGALAAGPAEWVSQLERLLDDWSLRARLGLAARRTVETRYAASIVAPRVVDVLARAMARSRASGE